MQQLARTGWALRPQTNAFRVAHDLSGVWSFRLDPGDEGRERGWYRALPQPVPVGVPSSWNDQVPGARDELGPAWYERRFELPPVGDRDAAVRFGSVAYAAEVWLNGEQIGGHEGGHLPFALPCSAALRPGENVLTVPAAGRLGPEPVPTSLVPPAQQHVRCSLP